MSSHRTAADAFIDAATAITADRIAKGDSIENAIAASVDYMVNALATAPAEIAMRVMAAFLGTQAVTA